MAAIHSSTPPSGLGDGREGAVLDDVLDAIAAERVVEPKLATFWKLDWFEGGKLGGVDADERLVEDRAGGGEVATSDEAPSNGNCPSSCPSDSRKRRM
jgi:hypothetical protein